MLASIFILQGFDTLMHPERVSPLAEPVVRPVADNVPVVPSQTETAVRISGGVQLVAGSLLGLGWLPRLSALAISATLVPTTLAGHRFWAVKDDEERAKQRIHFLKNVSMLGGLLIAAGDTAGRPSLAWRGRYAAKTARRNAVLARQVAALSGKAAAKAGSAKQVAKLSGKVGATAARGAKRTAKMSGKAGATASGGMMRAAKLSGKAGATAGGVKRAAKLSGKAGAKAGRSSRRPASPRH